MSMAAVNSGTRCGGTIPVRMNRSRKPMRFHLGFELPAQRAIANPKKSQIRMELAAKSGAISRRSSWPLRSNSRAMVPTTMCSAVNPSDDRTSVSRHGRVQERRGFHSAINRDVLLGPADAGGQRLLAHRIGDADDPRGERRGLLFERFVDPVNRRDWSRR